MYINKTARSPTLYIFRKNLLIFITTCYTSFIVTNSSILPLLVFLKNNMQNQNMNLVLSTDAKPRLKWTSELHLRFVEGVNQLGGPEKATPKSLMRVMGIPGLTLYHLKSHLQKYRLGKSTQPENCSEDIKQEDYVEVQETSEGRNFSLEINDEPRTQIHEGVKIAEALQLQMEVQRKLHEQIEVQRHLQLRIEAQGKYLQSVLKKAQETLAGYTSSSLGVEFARSELSRLVSLVNAAGCPSSSLSELTESKDQLDQVGIMRRHRRGTLCSVESSLTSSESSGRRDDKTTRIDHDDDDDDRELLPKKRSQWWNRKRNFDGVCVEQPVSKRSTNRLRTIDLNAKYQNDVDI